MKTEIFKDNKWYELDYLAQDKIPIGNPEIIKERGYSYHISTKGNIYRYMMIRGETPGYDPMSSDFEDELIIDESAVKSPYIELVMKLELKIDRSYVYMVNRQGNVSRVPRAGRHRD